MIYAAYLLIHIAPFAILAALGIVLFRRHRSVPTALIVLGFVAVIAGQVSSSFVTADVSRVYNAHGDVTAVVGSFHGFAWIVSRYGATVGMWIASIGAAAHVLRGGAAGRVS
jgi:hypothetical protein